ncbi:hypothetical protein MVEG_12399 [Podila verticillata NRRL 6337]|uniref:WAP domain-containing protein n=1 Tax=Podila verticillata NRRL 6337 TaxID=1069443 RepID=A0A086TII6_9FUNG|nr:hypothetical protein MVEG_12399 [Podila verticillata NRRL 6337]
MKSISITLLGLFASIAYANVVCKSRPQDCPNGAARYDIEECLELGFRPPNFFVCEEEELCSHGSNGPQRLKNNCEDPGMRCSQDWQCCSGTCSEQGWCY